MKNTAQTKVLIIDDNDMAIDNLISLLKKVGIQENNIFETTDPEKGVDMSNHNFDYIFIDFQFDNRKKEGKNGAYYGNLIRQKTGIPALILVTAYGDREENIQEFIWVGFDAFILKKGEVSILRAGNTINSILDIAFLNSQKRLKSWFTDTELADERAKLDRFEAVAKNKIVIGKQLAPAEQILTIDPSFYDSQTKSIDVNRIREFDDLVMVNLPVHYRGRKLVGYTSLNAHFKVYEKGLFVAEEPALKVRQLLIENPDEWPNFRKCSPLADYRKDKGFLSNFNIQ